MKTARILFATVLAVFLMNGQMALGQWTESGGAVYLTNPNNKVGIGTSSPSWELTVRGGLRLEDSSTPSNALTIGNNGSYAFLGAYDWAAGQWRSLVINSDGEGTFGKVGIGTVNPTHTLTVEGQILAEEVIVVPDVPYADFVFEDDYELMPLGEVARYIEEHGHLPEIPSAVEVEADGLFLGEMQVKLLQKIEELTLYLIEQHKTMAEMQEENALLSERLAALERADD